MSHSITLNLPEPVYQHVARRARQMQRTIEDELLAAAAGTIPELSADLEHDLAQLAYLTDDELWQAARTMLPNADNQRAQQLVSKQQSAGLSKSEQCAMNTLLQHFDRTMLVRAQAALLLKQRGFDISELGPSVVLQ